MSETNAASSPAPVRSVFVAGATGYIGKAVVRRLVADGYAVTGLVRPPADARARDAGAAAVRELAGCDVRFGDVCRPESLLADGFRRDRYDAVVSCLASRTGGRRDAWAVDYRANRHLLDAARAAGVRRFILLSAICVQKPRLEFQRAKLCFEQTLINSGLSYSIVRPTAYFKSLSGQVRAVQRGRPFVVFGDGRLSACKPISENDLAAFIVDCLDAADKRDRVLPVGGPGRAVTPLQQGQMLFELCRRKPRFRRVPVFAFDAVIAALNVAGRVVPALQDKAEFARIGRYYATESMLALDPATGAYSEAATPSFGSDTLRAFYARVLTEGLAGQGPGDHAMFDR